MKFTITNKITKSLCGSASRLLNCVCWPGILAINAAILPLGLAASSQQAYLKASNSEGGDAFGYSVAVSGDTMVIGALQEASGAVGINGDEGDDSAPQSGAAYVFVRDGESWIQQAYLKASNAEAFDEFGLSVAISGDTIVVGASGESSRATGVNGNQYDNRALGSGAAYVFVRNGTTWSQQAYLKASNTGAGDQFGYSVGVSGDTIVVGALDEASKSKKVNHDPKNNQALGSGAAYVFVRNGSSWSQQAYLKASNSGSGDLFGHAVAVSDDTVVVGAFGESSNAIGVNGNGRNNSALYAGAAYVFVRNGTTWSQQAYLKASNTDINDNFGYTVAVSGDTIAVGAPNESSNAIGVNGDQLDNSTGFAGAVYVFARSGVIWHQQAYLKPSNTAYGDQFGIAVAVSGETVVAGASQEFSNGAGAAYVFARTGINWTQEAFLKASNADIGDRFGVGVAVSGNTVLAGAYGEASNATGVNGDQTDNSAPSSGAAYVFTATGAQ